ncbi:MAG: ACT domain-containing protein, partial [Candidatus Hodarchaeota archaeon]
GITIVTKREIAENHSLSYDAVWNLITLNVHSDLQAIGFLAVITNELAKEKISVNVVSAFYHDHLFVPVDKGEEALQLLKNLSKSGYQS